MRLAENITPRASKFDRCCDVCGYPMIGVIAGPQAPARLSHDECGGRPLTAGERDSMS